MTRRARAGIMAALLLAAGLVGWGQAGLAAGPPAPLATCTEPGGYSFPAFSPQEEVGVEYVAGVGCA